MRVNQVFSKLPLLIRGSKIFVFYGFVINPDFYCSSFIKDLKDCDGYYLFIIDPSIRKLFMILNYVLMNKSTDLYIRL